MPSPPTPKRLQCWPRVLFVAVFRAGFQDWRRFGGASRSRREADRLVAAGADADVADRDAGLGLEEGDVVARRLRQIVGAGDFREFGSPAGQLFVGGRDLVG